MALSIGSIIILKIWIFIHIYFDFDKLKYNLILRHPFFLAISNEEYP